MNPIWMVALGGLFVGYCRRSAKAAQAITAFAGLERLSLRSLVAFAVFVTLGMIAVFLFHHVFAVA
ncbi:MAG: hypothetical protein M3Y18_04690 [Candidatus Eremiobacteraeota bacterium]|nr:hypothetical protein [Candidatus Eremiobacteraeota bacterium]